MDIRQPPVTQVMLGNLRVGMGAGWREKEEVEMVLSSSP